MAKPPDPFAGAKLSEQVGLDQRLFQAPPPLADSSPTQVELKQPVNQPTGRPVDRKVVPPVDRNKVGPTGRKTETKIGRTVSRLKVQSPPPDRIVEHRAYDYFQDQVRWLNRRKVELEEAYGKQVAATKMVQLAVDLLIADYEENAEGSQIVRVLIGGAPR